MQAKKVNISVNPDTLDALAMERDKLSQVLGFKLSYSQVIQNLIQRTTGQASPNVHNQEGEANE